MTRDQFMLVRDIIEDAYGDKLNFHHHDIDNLACTSCVSLYINKVRHPERAVEAREWVQMQVKGSKLEINLWEDWDEGIVTIDLAVPGYRDKLKNVLVALLNY